MLTKEERSGIAKRAKECIEFGGSLYKTLFGCSIPCDTSIEEDDKEIIDRILDLCDTSNMIELPLDKNGEVIRVGDIVYNEAGSMLEVKSIEYSYRDRVYIRAYYTNTLDEELFFPQELTHKTPETSASLAEKIRNIVKDDDDMSTYSNSRLSDIADQLEKLGNDDD